MLTGARSDGCTARAGGVGGRGCGDGHRCGIEHVRVKRCRGPSGSFRGRLGGTASTSAGPRGAGPARPGWGRGRWWHGLAFDLLGGANRFRGGA